MLRFYLLTVLTIGIGGKVEALTVQLDGANQSTLPEVVITNGSGLPSELTLQLANTTLDQSPSVLLWQLGLHIRPETSSSGAVQFSAIRLPDHPLFGDSDPGPPIDSPSSDIVVSDTDPMFTGVTIEPQTAKHVIALDLILSAGAEGLFKLTMSGVDETDPDHSSFWIPASDTLPMNSYDNAPAQQGTAEFDLAVIRVTGMGLAGDYNGNGIVDAADYTVWRDTLGSTTNLAADGNNNNQIDAGDYGVWKSNFGLTAGSGAAASNAVPEPATVWLLLVGILKMCSRRRQKVS